MSQLRRSIPPRGRSGETDRADVLFREAIGAFASLTRPSAYEVQQVNTLAQALYEKAGTEARRFAAAVLSDNLRAPHALLMRLAAEPVAIAAPILKRSTAFSTHDWLHLIRTTGAEHHRIMLMRDDMPATAKAILSHLAAKAHAADSRSGSTNGAIDSDEVALPRMEQESMDVEQVRSRLRSAMAGNSSIALKSGRDVGKPLPSVRKSLLREAAFSGDIDLFTTALADALSVSFGVARRIASADGTHHLVIALRAVGMSSSEAHLILRAARPDLLTTIAGIRLFIERFESLAPIQVDDRLDDWRRQSIEERRPDEAGFSSQADDLDGWDSRDPVEFYKLSAGNDRSAPLRVAS